MKKIKELTSETSILPIGALSDALDLHQRTLRIYDKEGILSPKRTTKNRRSYSFDDLEKGKAIVFLTRNLALNLAGVKMIFAILEKNKIATKNYLSYIKEIAKASNIDISTQESNIEKTSKRGRKAKAKD